MVHWKQTFALVVNVCIASALVIVSVIQTGLPQGSPKDVLSPRTYEQLKQGFPEALIERLDGSTRSITERLSRLEQQHIMMMKQLTEMDKQLDALAKQIAVDANRIGDIERWEPNEIGTLKDVVELKTKMMGLEKVTGWTLGIVAAIASTIIISRIIGYANTFRHYRSRRRREGRLG